MPPYCITSNIYILYIFSFIANCPSTMTPNPSELTSLLTDNS